MKTLLLVISILTISGCTTIHFDNGPQNNDKTTVTRQWHHNMIFSLIEVSDPVSLKKVCGPTEWSSVKTEESFINGLVGGLVNSAASSYIGLGAVWYPKTVEVTCQ